MTTFFILQVVETMQSPDVSVVTAVTAIVGLGKVWDKVVGRGRDQAAKRERDQFSKRLDDHAASDAASFGRIDRSLAVLETGMGTVTKTLDTIDRRMYDAQGGK